MALYFFLSIIPHTHTCRDNYRGIEQYLEKLGSWRIFEISEAHLVGLEVSFIHWCFQSFYSALQLNLSTTATLGQKEVAVLERFKTGFNLWIFCLPG